MEAFTAQQRSDLGSAPVWAVPGEEVSSELSRLRADRDALATEVLELRAALDSAVTDERARIRRDLHDGAQHQFLAAGLSLRLIEPLIESDPQSAREMIGQSAQMILDAMADLRRLVTGDTPAPLAMHGLAGAVGLLAERMPIPVDVVDLPEFSYSQTTESDVYFIVSELLTNVIKHSGATRASVSIVGTPGLVVIEVRDDGCGGAHASGGSGLSGLERRTSSLEVLNVIGGGTLVRATVPRS